MIIKRFRKKPIEVEAVQVTNVNKVTVAKWAKGRIDNKDGYQTLLIPTLEGELEAQAGTWIVRGVEGEFYPIADRILRATYDEIND